MCLDYNLQAFEDLVRDGYLKKAEKGDLVLYGYTDQTTFERAWQSKYTLHARGIIFNKKTGELVAKPFPKFFNLGEMENISFANLPKEPYRVYEKVDGSLGIIFFYEGEWHIATRGSFSSEQAIRGAEILKKYNLRPNGHDVGANVTLLVEIIYPDNKIIVDYKGQEKLVILGAYDVCTQEEFSREDLLMFARNTGMGISTEYGHTIEEMIALQKTLPKDDEGFVVRFESGLRVKIKGDEYMRIAKMISQMSPLSFWEAMKEGRVGREYVQQLPEEFRKEYEPMIEKLEQQHLQVLIEIQRDAKTLAHIDVATQEGKKQLGLLVQGKNDLRHPQAMFLYLNRKVEALDKYVMRKIRPTGNAFVGLE